MHTLHNLSVSRSEQAHSCFFTTLVLFWNLHLPVHACHLYILLQDTFTEYPPFFRQFYVVIVLLKVNVYFLSLDRMDRSF